MLRYTGHGQNQQALAAPRSPGPGSPDSSCRMWDEDRQAGQGVSAADPMPSIRSQLLPLERGGRRDPPAKGPPHHGDTGRAVMDRPRKEGMELRPGPWGGQGRTLLQPLLPLGELGVTPRGDTGPSQLVHCPVAGCCSPAPGDLDPITAHGMGKGGAWHPDPLTGQSHGTALHARPQERLHSHCQSHSATCTALGLGSHLPLRCRPPAPARAPRGWQGATTSVARGSWGRQAWAEPPGSGFLQPGPACCPQPPSCPAAGRTQLVAEPRHSARPDVPAREAGAPRPLSCFLRAAQAELPAASRGSGSTGVTTQREPPRQLGPVPKGCGCPRDAALPCCPGALCSRGTAGDEFLPSTPLQRARSHPLPCQRWVRMAQM